MFRAGIYARVSTNDQQTIPLQIRALREYAVRRGWTIALQVKEVGSGASERQLREKLLDAARRREIDVVLVWRLDRWGRSVADLLSTLQELDHLGVGFVSLTEALDLTTPAGRAMAALLAVFAEFEREILRERVRAGLAHARRNGKKLDGPSPRRQKPAKCGRYAVLASARLRSRVGCRLAAPPCVGFWGGDFSDSIKLANQIPRNRYAGSFYSSPVTRRRIISESTKVASWRERDRRRIP
jgi:putative DNA-invertase from lambdoid prophage Rac